MNNAATVAAVGGLWRLCDWKKAVAIKKKTNEWILVGVVTLIGFALFAIAMMFVVRPSTSQRGMPIGLPQQGGASSLGGAPSR